MKSKRCPACGGNIRIYYDHEVGDYVYCEECEREFLIRSLSPIRLEYLEHEEDYYFEEDEY